MLAREGRLAAHARIAVATACAEGMGASASRSRLTVPPSTSTQRTACGVQNSVASSSSARVCGASVMLRRKRITPPGRTSLSHARSRPVSSVAAEPHHEQASGRSAKILRHDLLLQFLPCNSSSRFSACSGVSEFTSTASMRSTMRCESGVKMVICIGSAAVSTCTLCRSCFSCCRSTCLRALNHRRGQAGQPRHFNAIALAGRAGLDGVQKDDAARGFFHAHAQIAHARQFFGQHGQLVVVRGKERARARLARADIRPLPRPAKAHQRSLFRAPSRRAESASAAWPYSESLPSPSSPP